MSLCNAHCTSLSTTPTICYSPQHPLYVTLHNIHFMSSPQPPLHTTLYNNCYMWLSTTPLCVPLHNTRCKSFSATPTEYQHLSLAIQTIVTICTTNRTSFIIILAQSTVYRKPGTSHNQFTYDGKFPLNWFSHSTAQKKKKKEKRW